MNCIECGAPLDGVDGIEDTCFECRSDIFWHLEALSEIHDSGDR